MTEIKKENYLRRRVKNLAFTLYNKLENNNNAEFKTNGEERLINSLLQIFPHDIIVFDIGANVGDYSKIIIDKSNSKGINCNLHLFEPSKKTFEILLQRFTGVDNIFLNNLGASDDNMMSEIYFDKEGSEFASLYPRNDYSGNLFLNKHETVSLIRIDNYIFERSINKIDLLKIDIEGHELAAFKGIGEYLTPNFIKAIQFEYGGANLDSKTSLRDIFSLLLPKDYSIFKIMKDHLEERKYESRMDNFQYSNYVALAKGIFND